MNKVKVWIESAGIQELLKSEEVQDLLFKYANDALGTLGDGYEAESYMGTDRAKVRIRAVTHQAYKENMEQNTILKAVSK